MAVLTQRGAWILNFHVLLGIGRAATVFLQQSELALGEFAT